MNNTVDQAAYTADMKISFSDKIIGVLTEPFKIFTMLAQTKPSFVNWMIPLFLLIAFSTANNYLMLNNPVIRQQAIEKQMNLVRDALSNAVSAGQISQEQADARLNEIEDQTNEQIDAGMVTQLLIGIVATFVIFFLVTGVYYPVVKFLLKGEGNYSAVLSVYGLAYFVLVLQIFFVLIYALSTDTFTTGTSLAFFLSADTKTFGGFVLSKLDPFTIWFYYVIGVGLAKMFKSVSIKKYLITVYCLWFGFNLIIFFAAKELSFLQLFLQ